MSWVHDPQSSLAQFCESVSRLKVLVVGDLILDEYRYCSPVGTTTKAPAISVLAQGLEIMLGGAAAVARHCANFAKEVDLWTRLQREDLQEVRQLLAGESTDCAINLLFEESDRTPRKVRYISSGYPNTMIKANLPQRDFRLGQKLFEVAYLPEASEHVRPSPSIDFSRYDLVLVLDFGHGFLNRDYWERIRKEARFVGLNVQTNSTNYGFNLITKYKGADLICLDELEARLACADRDSKLNDLLLKFTTMIDSKEICITRGIDGLILIDKLDNRYHFPALADKIVDPVGAGDAVFSVLTMAVASGLPICSVGGLTSAAGAAACQIIGNRESISRQHLLSFMNH